MNRSRVVVVSRSYYPDDPRLARQASALIAAGYRVDVICLHRPGSKEPSREQVDDVGVLRLGGSRARGTRARYVVEYAGFAAGAATALLRERHRLGSGQADDFHIYTAVVWTDAAAKQSR